MLSKLYVPRTKKIKCLKCKITYADFSGAPVGWETRLMTHLKKPRFVHVCPKCIIT